jgi:hypothetical protein
MVNAPISIPLALSQSRKPSDLVKTQAIAADALKIEHYINSRMDQDFVREFDFSAIAVDLSLDRKTVSYLLSKLAGNENAITICNPQKRPRTPSVGRAKTAHVVHHPADTAAPAWVAPNSIAAEVKM